jgi:hypothetical protein
MSSIQAGATASILGGTVSFVLQILLIIGLFIYGKGAIAKLSLFLILVSLALITMIVGSVSTCNYGGCGIFIMFALPFIGLLNLGNLLGGIHLLYIVVDRYMSK